MHKRHQRVIDSHTCGLIAGYTRTRVMRPSRGMADGVCCRRFASASRTCAWARFESRTKYREPTNQDIVCKNGRGKGEEARAKKRAEDLCVYSSHGLSSENQSISTVLCKHGRGKQEDVRKSEGGGERWRAREKSPREMSLSATWGFGPLD